MSCLLRLRVLLPALLWALVLGGATAARADFRFVHITGTRIADSDAPGGAAAESAAVLREIRAGKPAFVLHTGDVTESGAEAEYARYRRLLVTELGAGTPVYAVPGIRDVGASSQGREGFERGTGQPRYQSWNYPRQARRGQMQIHFVLLDSTAPSQTGGRFDPAQLDWLRQDLAKVGPRTPIVVGFHHPIGADLSQVDNTPELLNILHGHNVRLLLVGSGRSDRASNIAGIPVLAGQGLPQGTYHVVEIRGRQLRVLRRTAGNRRPVEEVLTESLARPATPTFSAEVRVEGGGGRISVRRGSLPDNASLTFRLDEGDYQPMTRTGEGWGATFPAGSLSPGAHNVTVQATLPASPGQGERVFLLVVPFTLSGGDAPAPQ